MPRNQVKEYVHDTIAKLNPGNMIIDIGAGEDPNYYEPLFTGKTFHKLDLVQNKAGTINYVMDLYNIRPALKNKYSMVLCLETLEHLPYPREAVKHCTDLITRNGFIILSSVTAWGVHNHPKDYWRFLPDGFTLLLQDAGLKIIEVKLQTPDASKPTGIFAIGQRV